MGENLFVRYGGLIARFAGGIVKRFWPDITYYVSTDGSDNYNGLTVNTPWQTLDYVNSQVTRPGSTIALKKGDIFTFTSGLEIRQQGTSPNRIIWDGSLWGTDASNAVVENNTALLAPIKIPDGQYLTFQNIIFDGDNQIGGGIVLGYTGTTTDNVHHITIQNCEFKNHGYDDYAIGLLFYPNYNDCDNIIVIDNHFHHITAHAIAVYKASSYTESGMNSNILIQNNTIEYWHDNYTAGAGIIVRNETNNVTIENNVFQNNNSGQGILVEQVDNAGGRHSINLTIRHNSFDILNHSAIYFNNGGPVTSDVYGNIINIDSSSTVVGGFLFGNGDTWTGASIGFYNNTIVHARQARGLSLPDFGSSVLTVSNNIVFSNDGQQSLWKGDAGDLSHNNNLYYKEGSTYTSVWVYHGVNYSTASAVQGWEATAQVTDPSFIDNFTDLHLNIDSSAIGAGVDVSTVVFDFDGSAYGSPPTIGAFERIYNTYYVSTDGSDNYDGLTTSTAWQTLDYAESTAGVPGDTVALKKGDIFSLSNNLEFTKDGALNKHIIWDGSLWGSGNNATIQSGVTTDLALIRLNDVEYRTIQNVIIDGDNQDIRGIQLAYVSGVPTDDVNNITIQDCEIKNTGYSAIILRGQSNYCENIIIKNNYIHDVSNHGISIYPTTYAGYTALGNKNVLIENNNIQDYSENDSGVGILLRNKNENITIIGNIVDSGTYDSLGISIESADSDVDGYSTGVVIKRNKVIGVDSHALLFTSGGAVTADVFSNILISSDTGDNYISCLRIVADIWTDAEFNIYNNTLICSEYSRGFYLWGYDSGTVNFKNNLIYSDDGHYCVSHSGDAYDHTNNLYYKTGSTVTSIWVSSGSSYSNCSQIQGWEATAQCTDPSFNTNFTDLHLNIDSSAIGAGIAIPDVSMDYDGLTYNDPPTIGAYKRPVHTFYVSTDGDDASTGLTEDTAWETLAYAESQVTIPGDTVALKKGDTFGLTSRIDFTHSGSSGSHIIWDGSLWGDGSTAIIQNSSAATMLLNMVDVQYLTIQNLIIDGNSQGDYGIFMGSFAASGNSDDVHDITIQNCEIKNTGDNSSYAPGIFIRPRFNETNNIIIKDNYIHHTDSYSVGLYPNSETGGYVSENVNVVLITGNTFENWHMNAAQSSSAIILRNGTNNVTIEHNIIKTGQNNPYGISIEHSASETNHTNNCIIRYNWIESVEHSIYITNGESQTVDIYGNILKSTMPTSNYRGCVWIQSGFTWTGAEFNVSNNTMIANTYSRGFSGASSNATVTVRNNIFYSNDAMQCYYNSGGTITHSNNLYYKIGSTYSTVWVYDGTNYSTASAVQGWEATAQVTDPSFNTNFTDLHLNQDSSAIGAGIAILGITLDYDGETYLDPPNIGAYAVPVYEDNFESYSTGTLAGQGNWITGIDTMTVSDSGGDKRVHGGTNSTLNVAIFNKPFVVARQFAEVEIDQMNTDGHIGVAVRLSGDSSTLTGYTFYGNSSACSFGKIDNGVKTTYGNVGNGFIVGDIIKLEADGSTFTCYRNGEVETSVATNGQYSDASYGSGKAGLSAYSNLSSITCDNWSGGSFNA